MIRHYALLLLAVGFNVGAYLVFRSIAARAHDWQWATLFALGLALGGINTLCFTLAMREIRLAIAYPIFSGISITLVVIAAALLFGERMSAVNLAGAALVIVGVALLTR